jgi:hypothetical protein
MILIVFSSSDFSTCPAGEIMAILSPFFRFNFNNAVEILLAFSITSAVE